MNPKASVIIPVYNAEKTLRRCVESLVLGYERNIEVILCEDCSKDNSWELCCTLAKEFSNVRCVQNHKNSGVSHTRNIGLCDAQGEYILFVDSDDWVSQRYVLALLDLTKRDPSALPICGHHFIDKVNALKQDYLWDTASANQFIVGSDSFFDLCDKFLLQQLWNKIFRRDLIESHHIRFDESQSMGEDFQFVLDYLEAAQIKKCIVLNEPLYYYIRWNASSLMSKFGFIDNQPEYDRMEQLARIIGPGAESQKSAMIAQSKHNYIYHIARNRTHTKQEKLAAIERVMGDGKAITHYREQQFQFAKEQLAGQLRTGKKMLARVSGRLQRSQVQRRIENAVCNVNADGICMISQNCIGGILYHDFGLQFLSPTVNTFIPEPGFVKMVLNLRHYMAQELVIQWGETYPIGKLDDIEIHFMHYETCKEAKEAWERRKARINWDKIFVICTDRDGFDEAVYEKWCQIPYPKILFTANPNFTKDAVCFPEHAVAGQIGDLIPSRKFYSCPVLIDKIKHAVGSEL